MALDFRVPFFCLHTPVLLKFLISWKQKERNQIPNLDRTQNHHYLSLVRSTQLISHAIQRSHI